MITNEMKAKKVIKRITSIKPKQKAKNLNFYLKKWASKYPTTHSHS